jgi:co-chaperonin GroES (HSP10)
MIKPLGFCILVKPDPVKDQLKVGMIEIPDEVLNRQRIEVTTGHIIGIGPKAWKDLADGEPWASVGDHVVYAKHGGKIIEDPETGEKNVLLNDKDIIGLL